MEKLESLAVVNLPGNPLASAVNFEMFVKPAILKLSGLSGDSQKVKAKLRDDIILKREKDTVILGYFDGEYFTKVEPQKPGMISPLGRFNAIVRTSRTINKGEHNIYSTIKRFLIDFL